MIGVLRRVRSFGDKLTLWVTATSGVAVVAVCGVFAVIDYADLRRQTLETLRTQTNMVSLDSGAALVFDDRVHGDEALRALRAAPDVAAAALYNREGEPFASYLRADDPGPQVALSAPGMREQGRWLILATSVFDRGERQGQIQLVYDLSRVKARLWWDVLLSVAVAVAAMLVAYLVSRRIQKELTGPIDELVHTATRVSETRDYSLRAAQLSDDELGNLTRAFNEMLTQIEKQERDHHRSHAEREALLESERAARGEAERASRMKDDFVATLSHELRTPLTPIVGWVQILRRAEPANEEIRQGLEVIERNARLQTQMIDDLLDVSRIVSGKVRLDVQRVELPEVIEAAVATVRPAAEARGIRLRTVLDPRAGAVRGDPGRLQQVVWNLLSHAIKFTGKGGRVEVSLARINSHAEIVVSDSGQGIAAEFLPHVFARFRQADSSTTRRHGGLGLGLAIVRHLVELHGGTVRADSPGENLGATFTVALPLMAVRADAPGLPREHPGASRGVPFDEDVPSLASVRVLVVDDDRDARDLLARILEGCDATVLLAASAAEALQILRASRPDLVVSDIGMPRADGYELIRRVRELEPNAGGTTPAIALTAFARTEDRTRALRSGYQLHIAKPVEPAELIAAVASLSSRR